MQTGQNYLKVNDQVEIISGKDKGRVGKISKIFPKTYKATVEKLNIVKRHTKPSAINQEGGVLDKEAPIHLSNLMLVCNKCAKPVRIKMTILEDGTKVRTCKKCDEAIGNS